MITNILSILSGYSSIIKCIYKIGLFVFLFNFFSSCNGQTKINQDQQTLLSTENKKLVGGGCDGCEILPCARQTAAA